MRMRRAILVFGLIVSIGFQGMALAGRILGSDRSGDTAHAVLHADGVAHHHDGAGKVHKDASEKSQRHMQHDGWAQVAGVLPAAPAGVVESPVASSRVISVDQAHDSPFLEGLKRPPRST